MAKFDFTEQEIDQLIFDIHEGFTTVRNLPPSIYIRIANKIFDGIKEGFGGDFVTFAGQDARIKLLKSFQTNGYVFSAAKTFQQVKDMSAEVFKGGIKVPFNEFKKKAGQIFDVYNKTFLAVEHRTASRMAMSGSRWVDIQEQKEELPLLQYQTVGDARVRDEHVELDNVVKPVDDAFWDTFMPPLGWNCRCIVIQLEKGEAEITKAKKSSFDKPDKLFNLNPGKDGIIFKENHPYFKVAERYEVLKDNNFGLQIPL